LKRFFLAERGGIAHDRRGMIVLHGTKFLLVAGFIATAIQLVHGAEALRLIERPNSGAGPTQVSVGTN
jgi:hypothetical protein